MIIKKITSKVIKKKTIVKSHTATLAVSRNQFKNIIENTYNKNRQRKRNICNWRTKNKSPLNNKCLVENFIY